MDQVVLDGIQGLRQYRDHYYTTAKSVFGVAPANIYHTDFFFIGALNRSFCLLRGFCDLLESENFVSDSSRSRKPRRRSLRSIGHSGKTTRS